MLTHIAFQSIPVEDQQRALAFYRDRLGMVVDRDEPYGEDYRWIFMRIPGATTRIHFARSKELKFDDIPCLVLTSDDVDGDCASYAAAGVTIVDPPADAPWAPGTRWAMIKDSEGNLILIQSELDLATRA